MQASVGENLHFVFVVRKDEQWADIRVIKDKALQDFYETTVQNDVPKEHFVLYFSFQKTGITCLKVDFTSFRRNFNDFPEIL